MDFLWVKKNGPAALGFTTAGIFIGLFFHAFVYRSDFENVPKGPEPSAGEVNLTREEKDIAPPEVDLSSSRQLVETLFSGARIDPPGKKNQPNPAAGRVQGILRGPNSSYQKVAALIHLARTLPPDQRRLAYAGAAFACQAQEFKQLMLPLVWDPATAPDQAQVLAGGVIGLPDSVRLPICLTFLKHRDESIRLTGQAVLSAYFPDAEEADYPALIQAYLRNPD